MSILLIIICSVLFLIVGTLTGFYLMQERLIFNPHRLPLDYKFHFDLEFKERFYEVSKNVRLNAVLFKAEKSKGVIFYLHGNAYDIQYWGMHAQRYVALGYDFFVYDYRGYGKSGGKIRNVKMINSDSDFIYKELCKEYDESKVILFGNSLGSGIAARLAADNNPYKLILETPYYSFLELSKFHFPLLPGVILRYRFPTYKNIKNVKCKIYLFHGTLDQVIPYSSSIRLAKQNKNAELITIEGGMHNNLPSFKLYQQKTTEILS